MTNPRPLAWSRAPIVDAKTGMATPDFLRYLETLELKTAPTLNDRGEIQSGAVVDGVSQGEFTRTRDSVPAIFPSGLLSGQARNGDVVTFNSAYQTVPTVVIFPVNSLVFAAADSANDQLARYEAVDVTKTGFTVKAVILVDNFTTTGRSVVPTGVAPDQIAIKDLAAEAYNDQYTFQYDVTVNRLGPGRGGNPTSAITLNFEERPTGGGAWTIRDTANWFNTSPTDDAVFSDVTKAITVDGAVLDHEFRITVASEEGAGGSLDSFDLLSWSTNDSGLTERDATPDASHYVGWMAVEGKNE